MFSTQSTHKMLAGLSQASQILIQDSQNEKLDRFMFNEAFLMHTSTSPQYAIIASCDVAAAMMEPPGGTALVEESIAKRSSSAARCARWTRNTATRGGSRCGVRSTSSDGIGAREDWMLSANDDWHGFGPLPPASTCSTRSRPR